MSFAIDGKTYDDPFDYATSFAKSENVEDRREDLNLNEPKWENVIPSIQNLLTRAAYYTGVMTAPMSPEKPATQLGVDLGLEDVRIERNVGQSLLDDINDQIQSSYFVAKSLGNAIYAEFSERKSRQPLPGSNAQQIIGKPTETEPPPPSKPSFDKDWNRMVDDIIMAGPGWRPYPGWEQKGLVEDRRDDTIATTPPPPDEQAIREYYGDDINPKEYVMQPLAHDAGVNRLNEMIVRKESQVRRIPNSENDVIKGPANPKSDIDQLLEKLDRINKKKK